MREKGAGSRVAKENINLPKKRVAYASCFCLKFMPSGRLVDFF